MLPSGAKLRKLKPILLVQELHVLLNNYLLNIGTPVIEEGLISNTLSSGSGVVHCPVAAASSAWNSWLINWVASSKEGVGWARSWGSSGWSNTGSSNRLVSPVAAASCAQFFKSSWASRSNGLLQPSIRSSTWGSLSSSWCSWSGSWCLRSSGNWSSWGIANSVGNNISPIAAASS